jgi:hypothetical protein
MSLDLAALTKVEPKEDRMQKVWELIAARMKGLPSQIIFLDDPKIDKVGWRWAPRSLLHVAKGLYGAKARLRWSFEK